MYIFLISAIVPVHLFKIILLYQLPQTKKRNRLYTKQLRFFLLLMGCYCAFGAFSHLSSHLKNVRCHSMPFCGLSTQWFSSGNMSSSAGTPRSLAALKAAIPCEASMR